MAVIRTREGAVPAAALRVLRDAIIDEMNRPERTRRPPDAPVVIQEDSMGVPRYAHWYVIWSQFEGIDSELRAGVILDAVERKFGKKESLRVSMVMGLTPDDPLAKEIHPAEIAEQPAPAAVREPKAKYRTRR